MCEVISIQYSYVQGISWIDALTSNSKRKDNSAVTITSNAITAETASSVRLNNVHGQKKIVTSSHKEKVMANIFSLHEIIASYCL